MLPSLPTISVALAGLGPKCHSLVNDSATGSDSCQPAVITCNGQVIPTKTMPQGCNGSTTFCTSTCTLPSSIQTPSITESTLAFCPQIVSQSTNCNSSPSSTQFDPQRTVLSNSAPSASSIFSSANPLFIIPSSSDSSSVTTVTTVQTLQSPSTMSPSPPQLATPTPSNPPRTTSNAGAIAGGVVGGVLFLSLLTIGVLYFRRWRIQRRVAPSAEFMFLAGPGASYSRALSGSPSPEYLARNTPDPVLEKVYRSAEAQRRLDSNDTSVAAWEHPV